MVSSQQKEIFWVFDLVRQQQADGLQGLLASVYIVAEEQVVALWWEAAIFKKPEQIIVLPVDITWWDTSRGETLTLAEGAIAVLCVHAQQNVEGNEPKVRRITGRHAQECLPWIVTRVPKKFLIKRYKANK